MGTSLFNTTPAATYPALIKVGNNTSLDGTLKVLSDGSGNDSVLALSTASLQIGGATGATWDNTNKSLGIGTTTPTNAVSIERTTGNAVLSLQGNAGTFITISRFSDNTARPRLELYKSRGTIATPAVVQTGDELGSIDFYAYDGSANQRVGILYVNAESVVGSTITPQMSFGLGTSAGATTYKMVIKNDGNVTIGNEFTSLGARLGIKGSGSTSATTSLFVQNSGGTQLFRVYDDGIIDLGTSTHVNTTGVIYTDYGTLQLQGIDRVQINNSEVRASANDFSWANNNFLPSNTTRNNFKFIGNGSSFTNGGASGTSIGNVLKFNIDLSTAVGDVTLNHINIDNTINTTAGTTLQRGFYYNPTLTSTVGFTHNAIETVTGNVLLATTSGNVGIGTTSPTARLQVKGSGSTSATTSLLVQNNAATPKTTFSVNDAGTIVCGISGQGSVQLGTLNLSYPSTISYPSSYGLTISPSTVNDGIVSIDGSSIRFIVNTGITYTKPTAKNFLIQKQQGGADQTSFLNISGADQTDAGQAGAGGVVRIYGGLNNGIAAQGLVVLAHNGTTTQGAVVVGGTSANAAALLDIQSTTQGFLPPRMTTAERTAIASPPNGLIVFDTDVQNLCYRRDSTWVQVSFTAV